MQMVVAYAVTLALFVGIDLVWLGFIAAGFYKSQLGSLMTNTVNLPAAGAFYLLFPVGLVIFVVAPALAGGSWRQALLMGALFGFFAYATYDLTNLATLKDWPVALTFVDLAWGAVLSAVTASLACLITRAIAS